MENLFPGKVPRSRGEQKSVRSQGTIRVLGFTMGVFLAMLGLIGGLIWLYDSPTQEPVRSRPAPDFQLSDQAGHSHRLSDYLGRAVVLAFLPDLGPETRTELRSLQGVISELDEHGIKLFGVIAQDASATQRLYQEEQLNFPLLSDPGGQIARTYRVERRFGGAARTTVIVGPDGLRETTVTNVQPERHAQQVWPLIQCCLEDFAPKTSRALGERLPNFTLRDVVSGKQETLHGHSSVKATVVVFLSSQCPCSQGYDSRLRELAQEYQAKKVRFVGINASSVEAVPEVAAHAVRSKLPFPILKDPRQVVMHRLDARITPEVFVADSLGFVRYHGRIDDNRATSLVRRHDLREALDDLVAGRRPLHAETRIFGCAIPRLPQAVPTATEQTASRPETGRDLERRLE